MCWLPLYWGFEDYYFFCRKGAITPIQVATKTRQGRKACTLITGYEPFLVVDAEEMAEELRKACAGATSSAFVSDLLEKGKADDDPDGQFLPFRENL